MQSAPRALRGKSRSSRVSSVWVNTTAPAPEQLAPYLESGARPLAPDPSELEARGVEVVAADLLADDELIRHDPAKLARALLEPVAGAKPAGAPATS